MLLLLEGIVNKGILLKGRLGDQKAETLVGVYSVFQEESKWYVACWYSNSLYSIYPRTVCRVAIDELKHFGLAYAWAYKKR